MFDQVAGHPLLRGLGGVEHWLSSLFGFASPEAPGTLPTGVRELDEALAHGGFPRGGVVAVTGPTGGGKSTFALTAMLAAQRQGEAAAVIDVDFALHPSRGLQLGLDPRWTVLVHPPSGEAAVEITLRLMRSRAFSVVVVDSMTALGPTWNAGRERWPYAGAAHVAFVDRAHRALSRTAAESKTCLLLVEHGATAEDGEVHASRPGSRADLAIEVACVGAVRRGTERVGTMTRLRVLRDRRGGTGAEIYTELMFEDGLTKREWRPPPGKGASRGGTPPPQRGGPKP